MIGWLGKVKICTIKKCIKKTSIDRGFNTLIPYHDYINRLNRRPKKTPPTTKIKSIPIPIAVFLVGFTFITPSCFLIVFVYYRQKNKKNE